MRLQFVSGLLQLCVLVGALFFGKGVWGFAIDCDWRFWLWNLAPTTIGFGVYIDVHAIPSDTILKSPAQSGLVSWTILQLRAWKLEVDLPNSVVLLGHVYLRGMWFAVALRTDTQKPCVEKNWTACSKHGNHSRLNSQHNWRGLCDH